ncbi:unnamed protein product [Bathycoccus prasinos]
MTKPKHLYVPPEERTGAAVRTPAQLEALAKGRARYMEKVNARKEAGKKENVEEEEREEKEVDAEVDEPPEPEESPSPPPSPPPEPEEPETVPEKPAPPPREPSPPPRPASPPEDPLEINFVYDETNYSFNYTVSQSTLTQDLGVKVFSPTRPYFRIAGVPSLENSLSDRSADADGHSTHENHFSQLYICSDTLGLISREMTKGVAGVSTVRNTLLPVSQAPFAPDGNNRVIFEIPSLHNAFLTQRSYFTFTLKTNANTTKFFRGPMCPFKRMVVKAPNGQILEDLNDFHLFSKVKDVLYKSKCDLESEFATTKSSLAVDQGMWDTEQQTFIEGSGVPVIFKPHSGLLGEEQQFFIPVNQIASSAGYALHIELHLLDAQDFVYSTAATTPSYQITAMTYETELAQLSNELMRDVIGTKQIAIPYKYVRSHHNQLHGQQSYNVRITDAAQNLENTYSIIHKPQAIQTSVSSTNEHNSNSEPTTFYGGRETWEGDEIGGADDDLTKYVFKYGTKFFPNAPVELDGRNKTLALQSAISQLGLRNPVCSQPLYGTNNMGTNFEVRDFVLVNSFKTTGDRVENGINTAATSAPIEIDLSFAQATQNKQLITFVEQANTLYIKNDGISSMVKG